MSDTFDWTKRAVSDFRFTITVAAALVLGLLLLFFKEATPFIRDRLVPSLAVYTLGTGVIAGVQTLVATWRDSRFYLEFDAAGKDLCKTTARPGLPPTGLALIVALHAIWFILFCVYNVAKM
jgi:hypothetical protein